MIQKIISNRNTSQPRYTLKRPFRPAKGLNKTGHRHKHKYNIKGKIAPFVLFRGSYTHSAIKRKSERPKGNLNEKHYRSLLGVVPRGHVCYPGF